MDPQVLNTLLMTIASTSHLAVDLFLRLLNVCVTDIEESDDGTESHQYADSTMLVAITDVLCSMDRRVWARETSTEWWDHIVLQSWDDEQWLQNFRMRKATFMGLCDDLASNLRRMNTRFRDALSVEKRVAIAIWKLATPDCFRSVANQFGVGKSTVGIVLMQVCRAINRTLTRRTVTLGNVQDILDGFAEMGFPNCGGAVDGTHIPIISPPHLASEYINRKGYFSVVLQALVDHRGHFTDIYSGWPGKVHDARIFRNSALFRRLRAGTFFPDHKITVGDVEMPIVILGDPAYPLMPWLMKPYTGKLDRSKERFNYGLSRCRMTVERAFGRLKARWRSLFGKLDLMESGITAVISACCTLHNICEGKGERFSEEWTSEVRRLENEFAQPESRANREAQERASRIRDAIREQFDAESQQ
uniref:DDE Tnp4 domain-containing protein n=1 Tax=Gopherus evgoodei TaxID=1825980 RepID=A0A8C4Y9J3_9SAUR